MIKCAIFNSLKHKSKLPTDVKKAPEWAIIWCDEYIETINYFKSMSNHLNAIGAVT